MPLSDQALGIEVLLDTEVQVLLDVQAFHRLLKLSADVAAGGIGHHALVDLVEGVGERELRRLHRGLARHQAFAAGQDAFDVRPGLL